MSKWIDINSEEPSHIGPYFVHKMSECGLHNWYEVESWKKQDEYKSVYSEEFKQSVSILSKDGEIGFKDNDECFVMEWMNIPGHIYSRE